MGSRFKTTVLSFLVAMPGWMTPEQRRCAYLDVRCFTGFDRRDKEKKKPIPEGKALAEWKELLGKRFPQRFSGGTPFVLKIAKVVKDKKTQERLDLTGKDAILEHLAKWCERKCKEHSIDPGSEAMQALLQQAHWHEERSEVEALEPAASERERLHLNEKARQICPLFSFFAGEAEQLRLGGGPTTCCERGSGDGRAGSR